MTSGPPPPAPQGLKVVQGVSADLLLGRVDEDKNLLSILSSVLCFKNTQFLVLLCVLHAILGLHTFVHAVVLVFVGCLFFVVFRNVLFPPTTTPFTWLTLTHFFFFTHTILFLQEINRLTPSIVHG